MMRDNQQRIEEFVQYVLSFYGDSTQDPVYQMNVTRDDVLHALVELLLSTPNFKFEGDSIDREKVRDVMIANGAKWPEVA
jgi:hypothetical protein